MTTEEAIKFAVYAKSFTDIPEVKEFYALVETALREQEELRWIPVAERLPQNYISVLVYIPMERPLPTVHEAYIGGDGEWHSSVVYGVENEDVTHWMPLLEPPKEANDAKMQ